MLSTRTQRGAEPLGTLDTRESSMRTDLRWLLVACEDSTVPVRLQGLHLPPCGGAHSRGVIVVVGKCRRALKVPHDVVAVAVAAVPKSYGVFSLLAFFS